MSVFLTTGRRATSRWDSQYLEIAGEMPEPPFTLPYEASHFGLQPPFPLRGQMFISWDDLLRAVVTVGRWRTDVALHGRYSVAEAVHRVMCLQAYFHVRDGRLRHTPAHAALDPTEKGLVSYYLGMASAKLFAERCLNVPWLMHVSRYAADWTVTFGGDRRPDLFGCDTRGSWTVVEAKGRTRMRAALIQRMQAQKSSIATINGDAPAYRIGTATRFPARSLDLRVVDPPPDPAGVALTLDPVAWLVDYYSPVVDLLESGSDSMGPELRVTSVPGTGALVGMPQRAVDLVRYRRAEGIERPPPEPISRREERPSRRPLQAQVRHESDRIWLAALLESIQAQGGDSPDGLFLKAPDRS